MDSFITFAICIMANNQFVFVEFPDTPMTPITTITDDEKTEQCLEGEKLTRYVYYNGQWDSPFMKKEDIIDRLAQNEVDIDNVQSIFLQYVHPEDE